MKILKLVLLLTFVGVLSAFTFKITDGYKIGDKIENFSLKNIDDTSVSLLDYKEAKGFIIIFTCNTCPYSVANEDRIIALDKKYKTLGFPVIAINPNDPIAVPDDSFAKMKVRAQEKGFKFPYLLDDGQKVYPKFGATKTPHVYIVTKKDMKVQYIGAIDNSSRDADNVTEKYVENAVDALLAGKEIEKKETRAIGCSIKVQ
ncbi:thioredoxin family protein [Polaribacter sp. PL03]|uniref:thioredoxin family protein n=1 Tax=Polaribacter sp. PL03 TaxID=3088353 RepID=UPI0029D2894F|nr:thioredoxin family protein [Polaribacter sp. PL03]MDX6746876.1 thioredoxin family protein [Polaribacter sp. PL03]